MTAIWTDESERVAVAEPMTPIQAFMGKITALADASRDTPWQHDCCWCDDTGWTTHTCPTEWQCERGDDSICRRVPGYTHTYVRSCSCRKTNATYQRHHPLGERAGDDAMAAAATTKKGRR